MYNIKQLHGNFVLVKIVQFVPSRINDEKTIFPPFGRADSACYPVSLLGKAYYVYSLSQVSLASRPYQLVNVGLKAGISLSRPPLVLQQADQSMCNPPLISIISPVIKPDSGETRKLTTWATSSASQNLPTGIWSKSSRCLASLRNSVIIGVLM